MKCLILAGGTGDSLWPLSRKNYPKQFMNIKEGRSLLQETIVRNMPFCDEFIIITNESYLNIVDGQMKAFQGLHYRVILEGMPKGTAAAMALGCMLFNQSELMFVVSADNLIDGREYQDAVLEAKELVKNEGCLVAFGVKPERASSTYGYICRDGRDVLHFYEKVSLGQAEQFTYDDGYLWNSGLFLFRVGDFLNALKLCNRELYDCCVEARRKVPTIRQVVHFADFIMEKFPKGSVEGDVFAKSHNVKVVEIHFAWKDIGNVTDICDTEMADEGSLYCIENACRNVEVLNQSRQRQLVVANDLEDVVIVNTDDAVYVSGRDSVDNVKDIIRDNHDMYGHYFDYNRLSYREWGVHELLTSASGYKVKKVTVFPGMSMNLHQHEFRSEHWSVVEGVATITLGEVERDYHKFESVFVPVGVRHKVANNTDSDVVIIEVGIGDLLNDNDMVRIYGRGNETDSRDSGIIKLDPAFKDNLWGGTRLRTVFGKKCDYDIIAESWELSAHPDGQSRVASGHYRGMLFNEYLRKIGKDALGWKCQAMDRFPILIKFIDAKQPLSVQIHPDDEYALEVEGEYGKNEVWYVLDAEPDASLYCGLSRDISKDELKERIAANTVEEVLNEVKVKKGDVVFIKAGTIHAIGAGILICEIQQNSNSTYRLYDYGRRDKYGNLRELHVEKALDVVDTTPYRVEGNQPELVSSDDNYRVERIVQCKYFECFKYDVTTTARVAVEDSSFVSVVFLSGSGRLSIDEEGLDFKAGESFFVPAGKKSVHVNGKCEFIVTHV
jgi:mannose-1-phosphate guanylyltransferase/mannose-6-phosphate isomerase